MPGEQFLAGKPDATNCDIAQPALKDRTPARRATREHCFLLDLPRLKRRGFFRP